MKKTSQKNSQKEREKSNSGSRTAKKDCVSSIPKKLSMPINFGALIGVTIQSQIYFNQVVYFDALQTEGSLICADTGALLSASTKRFLPYEK